MYENQALLRPEEIARGNKLVVRYDPPSASAAGIFKSKPSGGPGSGQTVFPVVPLSMKGQYSGW